MLARALLRDRSSERRLGSLAGALAGVALAAALMTRAGSASAEPLRLHGEGTLARAVTGHQRSEFGFGARGLAALELPLWPTLGVEAELGALWLSERAAPADPTLAPHGSATALTGALGLRVRPFAGAASEPSAVGGLWLAGAAGVAETGGLTRALVEARAGYDLALAGGRLGLGPMVGLSHVFQPDSALRPDDANLLLFGVHAVLGAGAKRAVDGDRDRDGIRDSLDRCPDDPEDRDGFEDEDGCPDPDNDRDGIPDAKDRCPDEPEDRDGFEDEDGCPDPDNDQDGIPDATDQCPNEPETKNGYADEDGCPDSEQVRVVGDRIVLDDRVHFETNRSKIRRESFGLLARVATLILEHPSYVHIEVEGHADERGPADFNLRLSQARAESVRQFLIKHGVAADRLSAKGFGATKPLVAQNDERAWFMNRRVEFAITREKKTTIRTGGPDDPASENPGGTP